MKQILYLSFRFFLCILKFSKKKFSYQENVSRLSIVLKEDFGLIGKDFSDYIVVKNTVNEKDISRWARKSPELVTQTPLADTKVLVKNYWIYFMRGTLSNLCKRMIQNISFLQTTFAE